MTGRPAVAERALLTSAVAMTGLVGLSCVGLAVLARGRGGLLGALLGVALVLAFLLLGQLPVSQVARGRRKTGTGLLVLLYLARVVLLVAAYILITFTPEGVLDRGSLGLTVIASALGWTGGTVWAALRWHPMLVEPEAAKDEPVPRRW